MSSTVTKYRVHTSRDYHLFYSSPHSRPLQPGPVASMIESIQANGGCKAFMPGVCIKRGKRFEIMDGLRKFQSCRDTNEPYPYIPIDAEDAFSPQQFGSVGGSRWTIRDHVGMWASKNKPDYVTLLNFSSKHKLAILTTAALLSNRFIGAENTKIVTYGHLKITNLNNAMAVVDMYHYIEYLNSMVVNNTLLLSLMLCSRINGFKPDRLKQGAKRRPMRLMYCTRICDCLAMLEKVYNYGRHTHFHLYSAGEVLLKKMRRVHKLTATS